MTKLDPRLLSLLEDAALLQSKVPDSVLVGGSVAAYYAGHRLSFDHDHVISDLDIRFQAVLEALEADPEYVVNRVTPGKIILGEHNQIEYGIRQLIRSRPLEVVDEVLPSGNSLRVPTLAEALRIKSYLLIKRNQTRDYLDVAALSSRMGITESAKVLTGIDAYYNDPNQELGSVATQLVRMLINPQPADGSVTKNLKNYKSLQPRWQSWKSVCKVLEAVALEVGE